eukprot:gene3685-4241_t
MSIIHTDIDILSEGIVYKRGYFTNKYGYKLVTQEFIPQVSRGLVIILHGYGDHGQGTLAEDARKFASLGWSTFIFDQQGHGLSEGLPCFITNFDDLMDDSIQFINDISERFPDEKRFIYCCSMGGAIGLLVALARPDIFNGGLMLLAPLIKLDDTMVPNPIIVNILTWVSMAFPSLAIVPGENILDRNIKDPLKRAEHAQDPLTYKGRARIGTGLAILRVTSFLQSRLKDIKVPLFILHGSDDRVSSPLVSEQLYNEASSQDKTLKIYEGMWHGLTSEPDAHTPVVEEIAPLEALAETTTTTTTATEISSEVPQSSQDVVVTSNTPVATNSAVEAPVADSATKKEEDSSSDSDKEPILVQIPQDVPLNLLGTLSAIVDEMIVIKSVIVSKNTDNAALDIDSIVCLADRTAFGRVFEVFGQITDPYYSVRIPSNMSISIAKPSTTIPSTKDIATTTTTTTTETTTNATTSEASVEPAAIISTVEATTTTTGTTITSQPTTSVQDTTTLEQSVVTETKDDTPMIVTAEKKEDVAEVSVVAAAVEPVIEKKEEKKIIVLEPNTKVYFVNKPDLVKFVIPSQIYTKGYDASNEYDEEANENEMEFSDDEKEREFKSQIKTIYVNPIDEFQIKSKKKAKEAERKKNLKNSKEKNSPTSSPVTSPTTTTTANNTSDLIQPTHPNTQITDDMDDELKEIIRQIELQDLEEQRKLAVAKHFPINITNQLLNRNQLKKMRYLLNY